jgi:hypothetical protein
MALITTQDVLGQVLAVLHEAFEGPPERWSYFTDAGPAAGLFGTLSAIDAAGASRPIGGTSIAGHVHHVAFALAASSAWIRGERSSEDWKSSWSVTTVDEKAWTALKERIAARYQELRDVIGSHALASTEAVGGALGAIAHAAYHLGAIRQKAAALGAS